MKSADRVANMAHDAVVCGVNGRHRIGTSLFSQLALGTLYFQSYNYGKWGVCIRLAGRGQFLVRAVKDSKGYEWGLNDFAWHVATAVGVDLKEWGHGDFHVATPVTDVTTNACVRLVVQTSV